MHARRRAVHFILTASNGVSPANEFLLYSTSPNGVDFARVHPTP